MKRLFVLFVLVIGMGIASGQEIDDRVGLWMEPSVIETPGGTSQVKVFLSNQAELLNGWSFGIQADDSEDGEIVVKITNVQPGIGLETVGFEGGEVAFLKCTLLPGGNGPGETCSDCTGVTQEVVIDTEQRVSLMPTDRFEALSFQINVTGNESLNYAHLNFADEMGDPPVITAVQIGDSSFIPVRRESVEVRLFHCNSNFLVRAGDIQGETGSTKTTGIYIDFNHEGNADYAVQGWSYGIRHDSSMLELVDATIEGSDTILVKDGVAPDFNLFKFVPDDPPNAVEGFTHGVVLDFMASFTLKPINGFLDCLATYKLTAEPACPGESLTTELRPAGNLANPLVRMVVVAGGESMIPCAVQNGTVTINCPTLFLRGDSNGDGRVDIADGIFLFKYLYQHGRPPEILQAADVNDDGSLDVSDGIYIINFRFLNGSPPKPPYPEAGYDPTDNGPEI